MVKKRYGSVLVFGLMLLLAILFIWGNSCLPPEASSHQSGRIMRFLKPLLDPKNRVPKGTFHLWVRKAAHFTEFALLGLLTGIFYGKLQKIRKKCGYSLPILIALLVAILDEYIQFFTDRGSMVSDVLLDFCGALAGIGLSVLVLIWWKRLRDRKRSA